MKRHLRHLFLLFLPFAMLACSNANDKNSGTIDLRTGKHPDGWVVSDSGGKHPAAYITGPSACLQCHGKNLNGGISGVSCFSSSYKGIGCHSNGPGNHPVGWSAPTAHGAAAKALSAGRDGMIRCRNCHGNDFNGGITKKSCLNSAGCHGVGVLAPHSPKPWRSDLGGRTHSVVDASNATACAICHTGGANSSRQPSSPPAPGAPAGCFNNTLCHGIKGHAAGWSLPSSHGTAALAVSSGDTGFSSCAVCHGAAYNGGTAEQSCVSTTGCHFVNAPHPPKPWRSATGFSHTKADTSNAGQCAICHTGGANSGVKPIPGAPKGTTGCYDNTLCHGTIGHPAGWKDPAQHGAVAKKAPTESTGFSFCQLCHGAAFVNGAAVTCFSGSGCHGSGVLAPHPAKPWFSATGLKHTTTDPANAGTCAICHTAGANSTIKPPFPATLTLAGCFNNTLCHFHQIPYAPSATISPTLHGNEASKDLTICQACHGKSGSTSFDGITLANGTKTTACSSCHTFAKAHPTDWQGLGTYSHRTAGNRAAACALCHDVRQGAPLPLAAAPSCFSASFTNGLGQARGCHPSGPGVAPHGVPYNNHNATARSDFTFCLNCHQVAAFAGKPPGCQNCHLLSPVANPVNCVSCHAKPPAGATYPNIAKSHATHNALNAADQCAECHTSLGLGTVDHLNRARLRTASVQANPVIFGTLAVTGGLSPTFSASGSCTNTYCHGATLTGGSNTTPVWGQTGYLAGCGTCHGFPPNIAAHAFVTATTACAGCHKHVNASNTGFTDPSKHIDGKIDAIAGTAHQFPYPGALHATAGATVSNCTACHNTTSPGPYPVPSGTPPNCRACHLSSLGVGCSDCHALPPNGSTAPNRNMAHSSHALTILSCTTCHTGGGSGSLLHGYGTATVRFSAFAATGGLTPAYNGSTRQCTNTYCHGNTLDKPASAILSPVWSTPFPAGNRCSFCHGYPPQTSTHPAATNCSSCHQHVNSTNDGFTASGQALHINGTIEAIAVHSVPYFSHRSTAAASCMKPNGGCHNVGSGLTLYPLANDATTNAPDCRSCHTLADPLITGNGLGNCLSCHGSGGTGTLAAPTGSTWPNIRGSNPFAQHPSHMGSVCGDCHPGVDATGRSTNGLAGAGSGVNHGPNKSRLSGTTQTNSTQTVTGITPNAARGTGSTCSHSLLPNANCHFGPGVQTWTAP